MAGFFCCRTRGGGVGYVPLTSSAEPTSSSSRPPTAGTSESIGELGQKVEHPTPQPEWDNRVPTVPLKVGWLQPDDISPTALVLASDATKRLIVTAATYFRE